MASSSTSVPSYEPKFLNNDELQIVYDLLKDKSKFAILARELQDLGYGPQVAAELASDSELRTRTLLKLRIKLDAIRKRQLFTMAKASKNIVEYAFANDDMNLTDRIRFSLQPEVVRMIAYLFSLRLTSDLITLQNNYREKYYTRRRSDMPKEVMLAGAAKYGHWDRFQEAVDKGATNFFGAMIDAAGRNDVEMLRELMRLKDLNPKAGSRKERYGVEIHGNTTLYGISVGCPGYFEIGGFRLSTKSDLDWPLSEAVKNGANEAIQFLLESGAHPEVFIFAAASGNLEQFEIGLSLFPGDMLSLAAFAAAYDHANIMSRILDELIPQLQERIKTYSRQPPRLANFTTTASVAARHGHLIILKLILKGIMKLVKPKNRYSYGYSGQYDSTELNDMWHLYLSVLKEACIGDHPQIIALIIDKEHFGSGEFDGLMYGRVGKIIEYMEMTIVRKSYDCFELLFNKYLKQQTVDPTLMNFALKSENYMMGIVFLLIEYRIEPEIYNHVMRLAGYHGEHTFVDFLVERGANEFNYVAAVSAKRGESGMVFKMLDLGADNYQDIANGLISSSQFYVLQELIEFGKIPPGSAKVNIFARPHKFYTRSMRDSRVSTGLWLLARGFQDCGRAGIWAMRHNNQQILEFLMNSDHQCDGSDFGALLEAAAARGNIDMVKYALSRIGGRLNKYKYSAQNAAKRGGHMEIVELLS